MQGCSSRLCSWALGGLVNAYRRGRVFDLYKPLSKHNAIVTERISRASGILELNWGVDFGHNAEIRSKGFGRVGFASGERICYNNLLVSYSDANVGLVNRCVDRGTSSTFAVGALFQRRGFASSASFSTARRPQKTGNKPGFKSEGKKRLSFRGETGGRFKVRSKKSGEPVAAKRFSGALSSAKDVQSELTRSNSQIGKRRSKTLHRSARKPAVPYMRSASISGQTFGAKGRSKLRPSRKLKAEDRLGYEGEQNRRRRKRIRPHPRDVTFKRGLDSETPEIRHPVTVSEEKTAENCPLSANAKFRQIEPSRELLRQINEKLLGRRRLVEWRRAGFDPTRTAPLDDLPESKERRAPIQEIVFRQKLTFIAAAKIASSLPPTQYTEIAFAGRSNVGKSSLINALTRQWGVARTSEKPGLTQTINFFALGSELCLVDLPGYGFAFAKAQVKEDWEELVKEYVASRPNLKRVCLLVDAKWGLKPKDLELLQLMESSRTRYQIILTKTDVLTPLDLARRATQILQILKDQRCLVQPLIMVSSKSGAGVSHLRASLARVVSGHSRVLQTGEH